MANTRVALLIVLMLALLFGLGFAFLDRTAFDWKQHATAGLGVNSDKQPAKKETQLSEARFLPPSFDIASVDEKGSLVAAGRSEAGWIIQLKSKSQILGQTKADENNEWVLTPKHLFRRGCIPCRFLPSIPRGSVTSLANERAG